MAEYKRVLLKLSGEALAGSKKTGFDEATCLEVARQVKQLVDDGLEVGVVTGGDVPAKILTVPKQIRSECLQQL